MSVPISPMTGPNPFMGIRPVVLVARYVRVTGSGEVVADAPANLVRNFARQGIHRTFPQTTITAPPERTIPPTDNQKFVF